MKSATVAELESKVANALKAMSVAGLKAFLESEDVLLPDGVLTREWLRRRAAEAIVAKKNCGFVDSPNQNENRPPPDKG